MSTSTIYEFIESARSPKVKVFRNGKLMQYLDRADAHRMFDRVQAYTKAIWWKE
jgi:hypothetical protein